MPFAQQLRRRAAAIDVRLPGEAIDAMERHYRLLLRWNAAAGLTTLTSEEEILSRHFVESLVGYPYIKGQGRRLLDIGSGNGFPALPLLVLRSGLRGTLLEPSTRKWAFLKEVIRETGMADRVRALRLRADTAADLSAMGPIDFLTVRAVGGLVKLLPGAAEAIIPGGRVLLWIGREIAAEVERSRPEALEPVATVPLPGRDSSSLVVLERTGRA